MCAPLSSEAYSRFKMLYEMTLFNFLPNLFHVVPVVYTNKLCIQLLCQGFNYCSLFFCTINCIMSPQQITGHSNSPTPPTLARSKRAAVQTQTHTRGQLVKHQRLNGRLIATPAIVRCLFVGRPPLPPQGLSRCSLSVHNERRIKDAARLVAVWSRNGAYSDLFG